MMSKMNDTGDLWCLPGMAANAALIALVEQPIRSKTDER